MTKEVKKFDAEVGKVLNLMINSLYTNKEIFMRELISNASDACDKLRYLSQTDSSLIDKKNGEFKISVKIDKKANTITITDNGIGMNKDDLIANLGTVAASGTQAFINQLSGDKKKDNQLIGQFGVGFYSIFMVADKATVTSKKAGEKNAYIWESKGDGEYILDDAKDFQLVCGTEIILHIKDKEKEFVDEFRIKHIVKSYSDHIAVPIFFIGEKKEEKLNSASALWVQSKANIKQEQYNEFYKNVAHAPDEPWLTIHNKNEGVVEFSNLLFIPTNKTFDLFHPDRKCRVKLYIKRVFIGDEHMDIIPQYMRFLRGVVDSEDLPLNISRETLQHNAVLKKIKDAITKRVISELKKKLTSNRDEYLKFWDNFGGALKEGLCEPTAEHEKLLEISVFHSVLQDKKITLDEYIQNCKDDQKIIYYLSGDNPKKLRNSPQIEGLINKGIDVLLFTDTVDDFWVNVNASYKDYDIKSVTRSDIDLDEKSMDSDKEQDTNKDSKKENSDNEFKDLLEYFKKSLGNLVQDVKISKKLTSSPACLTVSAGGMDMRMEKFLMEQNQLTKSSLKILEINPKHSIITSIQKLIGNKKEKVDEADILIHLLHDQACIIEGQQVSDALEFSKRLNIVIEKMMK